MIFAAPENCRATVKTRLTMPPGFRTPICARAANPPIEAEIIQLRGLSMDALYMIISFIVVMALLNIATSGRID